MDRILIKGLALRCIIGTNGDERHEKQDVTIDVALLADLSTPCRTDRLEDTIDYRALKKSIMAMVESSSYYLIEALAEQIAQICLENPMVIQAQVAVEKPSALRFARSVGVEITRGRD
ncbi:MAG: dihydroneopterin aldolase [Armatimonadota bacterium]